MEETVKTFVYMCGEKTEHNEKLAALMIQAPDLLAKVSELQKENEQLKKLLDNCTHNSRL